MVVNFDIIKKAADGAVPIKLAAPGEMAQITVSIDDDKLPPGMTWTYKSLVAALRKLYTDFIQNNRFYKLKAILEKEKQFCHERHLVPRNKKSPKANFYNPNIIFEFDKHYTPKVSKASSPTP